MRRRTWRLRLAYRFLCGASFEALTAESGIDVEDLVRRLAKNWRRVVRSAEWAGGGEGDGTGGNDMIDLPPPIAPGPVLDLLVTDRVITRWTNDPRVYPWSTNIGAMHYLIQTMVWMGYEFELRAQPFSHGWYARFGSDTGRGYGDDAPSAVARAALRTFGYSILQGESVVDFDIDDRPCPACGGGTTCQRLCPVGTGTHAPECRGCAGTGIQHWCPVCGWDRAAVSTGER